MDYICIGMSTDWCQMQRKLRVLHNQKCHDMDIGQLDNATTFNTFSFLFCLVTTWWQRALHAMDVHVHERRALECARKKQKTWNFYENFVWFSIFIFLEFFILSEEHICYSTIGNFHLNVVAPVFFCTLSIISKVDLLLLLLLLLLLPFLHSFIATRNRSTHILYVYTYSDTCIAYIKFNIIYIKAHTPSFF